MSITRKDFPAFCKELNERADEVMFAKNPSYTIGRDEDDVCANFKVVAELLGISPEQVCLTYYLKHVLSAIGRSKGCTHPDGDLELTLDLINYPKFWLLLRREGK